MVRSVFAATTLMVLTLLPAGAADKICIAASLQYSEGMVLCYGEHIQLVCKDGVWQSTQAAPDPDKPSHSVIVNACTGMPPTLPMTLPTVPPELAK
jgi:hypothetical protein